MRKKRLREERQRKKRAAKAKRRGRGRPFQLHDPAKLAAPPPDVDSRETERAEAAELARVVGD